MILRLLHVTVHEGMGPEFETFSRDIALPLVKKHPGLRSVQVGAPRPGAPNTFCVSMVWDSVDALKAFAGETWTEALIEPEEEDLVAAISVEHYDLIAATGGAEA